MNTFMNFFIVAMLLSPIVSNARCINLFGQNTSQYFHALTKEFKGISLNKSVRENHILYLHPDSKIKYAIKSELTLRHFCYSLCCYRRNIYRWK